MAQVIGVTKEVYPGEKRVATVPEVVPKLAKLGFSVIVQSGAGEAASISDEAYAAAGATITRNGFGDADIVLTVRRPSPALLKSLKVGTVVAGALDPYGDRSGLETLA